MKIAVKVSVFIISILLVMLILMELVSRNSRATECETALASAVEQSLKQLVEDGMEYSIDNYDAFVADFCERLLLQINSDSDIRVEILDSDMEKGILNVQVTEIYQSMRGNEKEYSYRKTVFLEEFTNNYQKAYRTIKFMAGDHIHRQYVRYDGSNLVDPGLPKMEGKEFKHWRLDGSGEVADIEIMKVNKDMTFIAVFD